MKFSIREDWVLVRDGDALLAFFAVGFPHSIAFSLRLFFAASIRASRQEFSLSWTQSCIDLTAFFMLAPLSVTIKTTLLQILNFSISSLMTLALSSWVWLPNKKIFNVTDILNILFGWLWLTFILLQQSAIEFLRRFFASSQWAVIPSQPRSVLHHIPAVKQILITESMAAVISSSNFFFAHSKSLFQFLRPNYIGFWIQSCYHSK